NIKLDGLTAVVKQWATVSGDEAPSAEEFGLTDASVQESSLLPDVEIKNLDLSNILVEYQDSSAAMDTRLDIRKLTTEIKEIDLNKEIVRLGKVTLDESDSQIFMGKVASASAESSTSDSTSA